MCKVCPLNFAAKYIYSMLCCVVVLTTAIVVHICVVIIHLLLDLCYRSSYIKGGYMIISLAYYILYYILIYLGNNYIIIIKLFYISSVQPTLTILLYSIRKCRWFLFFLTKNCFWVKKIWYRVLRVFHFTGL